MLTINDPIIIPLLTNFNNSLLGFSLTNHRKKLMEEKDPTSHPISATGRPRLELVPMPGKSSSSPAGVGVSLSLGAASNQSMASNVPFRSILGMVIQ